MYNLLRLFGCLLFFSHIIFHSHALSDQDIVNFRLDNGLVVKICTTNCSGCDNYEDTNSVRFYQHFKNDNNITEIAVNCTSCLDKFNKTLETVFVAHGYLNSAQGDFALQIRNAFFKRWDVFNLVFVDWSWLAGTTNYLCAIENVKTVGKKTAELIDFLVLQNAININSLTFIGNCLGAHIPNFMNQNSNMGKIAHLHALDPAGYLYERKPNTEKLDSTDAKFVSVIHSDDLFGFGTDEQKGHVDFYPGGGGWQPGCPENYKNFTWDRMTVTIDCSHRRAYKYFAESIAQPDSPFVATKCDHWQNYLSGKCKNNKTANMGWNVETGISGMYFMMPNKEPPYGSGENSGAAINVQWINLICSLVLMYACHIKISGGVPI